MQPAPARWVGSMRRARQNRDGAPVRGQRPAERGAVDPQSHPADDGDARGAEPAPQCRPRRRARTSTGFASRRSRRRRRPTRISRETARLRRRYEARPAGLPTLAATTDRRDRTGRSARARRPATAIAIHRQLRLQTVRTPARARSDPDRRPPRSTDHRRARATLRHGFEPPPDGPRAAPAATSARGTDRMPLVPRIPGRLTRHRVSEQFVFGAAHAASSSSPASAAAAQRQEHVDSATRSCPSRSAIV